jgi:uncharacterized cupin superfamily protein
MADTEFLAGAEWERAPTGRMVRIVELYRVGNVRAGIWEGEPGKTVIESHPYDEYCTVTAGELVVTDAAGNQKVFMKGDSFALPKGFKGFWDVRQRVRKNYFISE